MQKAYQFVLNVYAYTKGFLKEELYGSTFQFRGLLFLFLANIAEGYKKSGIAAKAKFMNLAQGSLEKCEYYLILSKDLGYVHREELFQLLNEISNMIEAYRLKLLTTNSILKNV